MHFQKSSRTFAAHWLHKTSSRYSTLIVDSIQPFQASKILKALQVHCKKSYTTKANPHLGCRKSAVKNLTPFANGEGDTEHLKLRFLMRKNETGLFWKMSCDAWYTWCIMVIDSFFPAWIDTSSDMQQDVPQVSVMHRNFSTFWGISCWFAGRVDVHHQPRVLRPLRFLWPGREAQRFPEVPSNHVARKWFRWNWVELSRSAQKSSGAGEIHQWPAVLFGGATGKTLWKTYKRL